MLTMRKRADVNTPATGEVSLFIDNNGTPKYKNETGETKDFSNVFGQHFQKLESASSYSFSSSSFQNYLTMVPTGLSTGTYRIGFGICSRYSTTGRDLRLQLVVNGSVVDEFRVEPKDSGSNQRIPYSFVKYVDLNNDNTVTLQIATEQNGDVATVHDGYLEFWRVA